MSDDIRPVGSLLAQLNDGRQIQIASGSCDACDNEFFFHSHYEYLPKYCPYCGIQFVTRTGPLVDEIEGKGHNP